MQTHPHVLPARSVSPGSYGLLLATLSLISAPNSWATPFIQTQAIALRIIPAPTTTPVDRNCLACHMTSQVGARANNLKPGYQNAYDADIVNLTRLKALLNVLPTATVGTAGSGVARTDIYEVICAPGGVSLSASVRDLAPVKQPAVTVQLTQGASVSAIRRDQVDGDARFSNPARLAGGANAIYSVRITKQAYTGVNAADMGTEIYDGSLNCRNSAGAQTGLAWRVLQNQ